MRKRFAAFAVSIALACWARAAMAEELDLSDCPRAIQQAFKLEANGAEIETVDKNIDEGRALFGASVTIDGVRYWIVVSEVGALVEKNLDLVDGEAEAPFSTAPAAVRKTLQEEARDAKLETVLRGTENGKRVFAVHASINGKNYDIKAAEDGTLLEKNLALEGDTETIIPMADAPAAVQKTFSREARGGKIETIQKQIRWGETQYLANATIGESNYSITVAANGTLLAKAIAGEAAGK